MKTLRSDPALYVLMKDKLLQGLSGGYVDDFIGAGNGELKRLEKNTSYKFEMAEDQDLPCDFTGLYLKRQKDGTISQIQHDYLRSLEEL